MMGKIRNHALRRGCYSDNVDFSDRWVNPAGAEWHTVDIVERRNAGEYQNRLQTGLEARQNIGTQVIADNHRFFRMRLHFV